MLKTIALLAAIAVVGLLAYAATRPDTFKVQRSTRIHASVGQLQPLISDLHRFNTWNPYNRKDPHMQGSYEGPASGPGAVYRFKGNKDVGSGSLTIKDSQADKVTMQLDMAEPFEVHNLAEFTLVPQGDSTEVTWAMSGPSPFIAKLMGVVFNMDAMVGHDFEAGLANLKAVAEGQATPAAHTY